MLTTDWFLAVSRTLTESSLMRLSFLQFYIQYRLDIPENFSAKVLYAFLTSLVLISCSVSHNYPQFGIITIGYMSHGD
jgi:hypothetical protein